MSFEKMGRKENIESSCSTPPHLPRRPIPLKVNEMYENLKPSNGQVTNNNNNNIMSKKAKPKPKPRSASREAIEVNVKDKTDAQNIAKPTQGKNRGKTHHVHSVVNINRYTDQCVYTQNI